MEMLRHEDWVLENIDYQFLDEEDLKATSLLTGANSSQFIKSLPLEAPQVPLRTLFAELQDMRLLMAEVEADSILVTISLDLPEIGVRGEAVVTGVEPCPVILPGPGKVVLTTFHHASSHLIDLYLSPQPPTGVNSQATTYLTSTSNSPAHPLTTFQTSEEALLYPQTSRSSNMDPSWERIGVTGNHPIWSDDRHDYIAAMDLRIGERLKNLSGDTVYVQQKLPRPGPTPVYNLEVQDEHVYYVGTNGVLAHNSNGYDASRKRLYRGMKDSDGLPEPGTSGRTLGARPDDDLPLQGGNVSPGSGGMSVAPDDPLNLPPHRRPPVYGGTGNDPVWEIYEDELGPNLIYDQDKPWHGTIQPSSEMKWDDYLRALHETRKRWRKK